MKRIWKIIVALLACGFTLSALGLTFGASLSGVYIDNTGVHLAGQNTQTASQPDLGTIKSITVDADYADVEFIDSNKYGFELSCRDGSFDWSAENGELKITLQRKDRVSFFAFYGGEDESRVKIYLPKDASLENVSVKVSSGRIEAGDFSADNIEIENSYGKAELEEITGGSLTISLNSGSLEAEDIAVKDLKYTNRYGNGFFEGVTAETFATDSPSGRLELTGCKFKSTDISLSYGRLEAKGLHSSDTRIESRSGDVRIEGELTGGTVIRSSYGGVRLMLFRPKTDYSWDVSASYGHITLDGEKIQMGTLRGGVSEENTLDISVSSGNAEIEFAR